MRWLAVLAALMLAVLTGCTHTVYHAPGEAPRVEDVVKAGRACGVADVLVFPFPSGCRVEIVEAAPVTGAELERRLTGCAKLPRGDRQWCEAEARRQP